MLTAKIKCDICGKEQELHVKNFMVDTGVVAVVDTPAPWKFAWLRKIDRDEHFCSDECMQVYVQKAGGLTVYLQADGSVRELEPIPKEEMS